MFEINKRPPAKTSGARNNRSFFLEARFPGGELYEPGVGAVVAALVFVKFCDPRHFL